MISQIFGTLPEMNDSYYSRKLFAHFAAYGTDYDFLRFFSLDNVGVIGVFNSNMTISVSGNFDADELSEFIGIISPAEVELSPESAKKLRLAEYMGERRTLFSFSGGEYPSEMDVSDSPRLDDVFDILKTSFDLDGCYDSWLTDTSHRVRHGISRVFLYGRTTAGMLFSDGKTAFFGQIATSPSERGRGHARELLYWINDKYPEDCELFARDERVSFYEGIGFKKKYEDKIFIRRN